MASLLTIDLGPCMAECLVKWSRFVNCKVIGSFMLYGHDTLQNKVSGACLEK